jgi:septal ring factor EnvC (AmiA/AmiB activator)
MHYFVFKLFTIACINIFILFSNEYFILAQQTEIKQQSNKLSNIERNLREKQAEQVKLLRQERTVKRDLEFLNSEIRKTERRLQDLSRDIKTAEQNVKKASLNYQEASQNKANWNNVILIDIVAFNKMAIVKKYERNPIEYKIREAAIRDKKTKTDIEERRIILSSSDMTKWKKAKDSLLALRDRENKLVNERKNLIEEKNKLLKTTSAQRLQAEQEIRELQESAKALQRVMQNLIQESRRKEQQRKEEEKRKLEQQRQLQQSTIRPSQDKAGSLRPRAEISQAVRQASSKKRISISPPVNGRIILHFGKNMHDELNTYVISNGIKIQAANGSSVRSVESGTVVYLGQFRSYGNVIIIDHNGFFAVYGQLSSIFVRDNQTVNRGDVIARLGSGNNNVLYFEIRRDNVPDNPLLWFRK